MDINDLKLAVYLDEVSDDIDTSIPILTQHKLNYVVLRNTKFGNICDVDDKVCNQIRTTLTNNNISVISIMPEIGKAPTSELLRISDSTIDRTIHVAKYFSAPFVRFFGGITTKETTILGNVDAWMRKIAEKCVDHNLTPILEVTDESAVTRPADLITLITKHKRWKILFDPAQLVLRQKQEPFVRHWILLKPLVAAIDVHDYKIGVGFKPAGFGDAQLKLIMADSINTGFAGWYFLEPGLGRRHGNAVTRNGTFEMAVEALKVLIT
jgi:sugar phosphate isomerase/epimerase